MKSDAAAMLARCRSLALAAAVSAAAGPCHVAAAATPPRRPAAPAGVRGRAERPAVFAGRRHGFSAAEVARIEAILDRLPPAAKQTPAAGPESR